MNQWTIHLHDSKYEVWERSTDGERQQGKKIDSYDTREDAAFAIHEMAMAERKTHAITAAKALLGMTHPQHQRK